MALLACPWFALWLGLAQVAPATPATNDAAALGIPFEQFTVADTLGRTITA
jgi:hypothetical protein